MKKIVVIDGQGGGVGKAIIEKLNIYHDKYDIVAVGTNSTATGNMLRSGANAAATGENSVVVACRTADVITGPMGIVMTDSLMGEITGTMARAVMDSQAEKVLIPAVKCKTHIAGLGNVTLNNCIEDAVKIIAKLLELKQ